jgi:hypothetical protein
VINCRIFLDMDNLDSTGNLESHVDVCSTFVAILTGMKATDQAAEHITSRPSTVYNSSGRSSKEQGDNCLREARQLLPDLAPRAARFSSQPTPSRARLHPATRCVAPSRTLREKLSCFLKQIQTTAASLLMCTKTR